MLAACASTPNLPLRPDPSPPPGSTVWTFSAADGTRLLARTWAPTSTQRGVVVLMHGLKDYSGRYAHLAAKLAAHGYAVYAFDLRGHGRSEGPRVAPAHWIDYVGDLDRFLSEVERREPHQPVFLFGHSMGGAIAARTAEIHRPELAGLILSGPALAVDAPPLLVAATRLTGLLLPDAPALSLDNANFSSDPANAAAMTADPLISQPAAPASTAAGLIEGMRAIWRDADALTMPVLAMHGTADKLTAPSGSRALISRIPATDKRLAIYDGYFHDLLHEPGDRGPRIEDAMVAWLDAHTGGPALPGEPVYTGALAGDPRGWLQAVELAGGIGERQTANSGVSGALDFDAAFGRPRPVGWFGDLSARITPDVGSLALRPVGVAGHGGAFALGVDGGFSLLSLHPAWSIGARAELPLGFAHFSASAEWDRKFSNTDTVHTLGADGLWLAGMIRLFGDRAYWPHAHAGVGPAVIGGVDWGPQARGWFVLVGFELFGAD